MSCVVPNTPVEFVTSISPLQKSDTRRYKSARRPLVAMPEPTPTPAKWTRPCNDFMQNRAPGKRLLDAEHIATKCKPSEMRKEAPVEVAELGKKATHIMRTAFLEVTHELCHRAFKRVVTMDFALKGIKPPGLAMNAEQDGAVYKLAAWRVAQIWYGVGSDKEREFAAHCGSYLSQLADACPGATESLVVAMAHNLCVSANNMGGGGATMFAPVAQRNYLNNASPLLDNEIAVYCLLETCATGVVYLHASERLRSDAAFNFQLITMGGDDILARIDPTLYDTPHASRLVRTARVLHYNRNKDRKPWLRVLSTEPVFRVGAVRLDLAGHIDKWRAA